MPKKATLLYSLSSIKRIYSMYFVFMYFEIENID